MIELERLIEVKGGVEKALIHDLPPEVAPDEDDGPDDLGEGESLLPPFGTQGLVIRRDLLLGRLIGNPFLELAVDAVRPVIEHGVIKTVIGGQAAFFADVRQPVFGQLGGVFLDEVDEFPGDRGDVNGVFSRLHGFLPPLSRL